jgi:hypothetical protein
MKFGDPQLIGFRSLGLCTVIGTKSSVTSGFCLENINRAIDGFQTAG